MWFLSTKSCHVDFYLLMRSFLPNSNSNSIKCHNYPYLKLCLLYKPAQKLANPQATHQDYLKPPSLRPSTLLPFKNHPQQAQHIPIPTHA